MLAETVSQLQKRPVAAAAPPEALIIICTREEVAGRDDDDYGGGGGRGRGMNNNNKPVKTSKKTAVATGDDDDPDAANDDDGGVYEDNDDGGDAEGDGDAADPVALSMLEEGTDVKVIGGAYRGRQGTVIGIIQMSSKGGDNNAAGSIQKYRVQLVPLEVTSHRPTTAAPRKQASALGDPPSSNHNPDPTKPTEC